MKNKQKKKTAKWEDAIVMYVRSYSLSAPS